MFPSTSSRETLRFSGNKTNYFPREKTLSVYYKLGVEKDRDSIFTTITTMWKPGLKNLQSLYYCYTRKNAQVAAILMKTGLNQWCSGGGGSGGLSPPC